MRDVYFVHVINNFQASYSCISAKVLHAARDRMARIPHRYPRLCCEEKASYDVSLAYSFVASQGLAYEEHNES